MKLRGSGEKGRRSGNGRQGVDQYATVTAHSMTTRAQPVLADEGGYAVPSLSPLTPAAEMAIYEHVSRETHIHHVYHAQTVQHIAAIGD